MTSTRSGLPVEEEVWRRHPADVARLVASLLALVVALGVTALNPTAVQGVSEDLVALLSWVPDLIAEAATGLAQLAAIGAPIVLLVLLLVQRRLRLTAVVAVSAVLAAVAAALLQGWLDSKVAPVDTGNTGSWLTGAAFPSPSYIAGLAAVTTVLGPNLPRQWRRAAGWILAIAVLLRVVTAVAVPLHIGATLLIGVAVGSLALVVVGAPSRRIRPGELSDALARLGLDETSLAPVAERDDRFSARSDAGAPVVVEVIDRDARDAELFLRLVRMTRVRGIDDEQPGWSTERAAEHEALVTLLASGVASVPEILGFQSTESGAAIVVSSDVRTTPLAALPDDDLTDALLGDVWTQVAALHSRRIAHRRLDLDRVAQRDDTGAVQLTGLRHGTTSAEDTLLAIDRAELLTALSLRVGVERAVSSAASVLTDDDLAATLPVLQPMALSSSTRKTLKAAKADRPHLLVDLAAAVQSATDTEPVELLPMHRITVGGVVALAGTIFLLYVALALVANWDSIVEAIKGMNWAYVPGIVLLAALGYPAGAISLKGAVTGHLPFAETSEVMLAQSFLNRFTPANAGGMALRVRYLQLQGVDLAVAAASIGLTSAASGVMQVVFLIVFLTWSSSGGGLPFSLPDAATIAVVVLVILVLCGLLWLTPLRKKVVDSRAFASIGEILGEIRELARNPTKVVMLFGGAGLSKLLTIIAFSQSLQAFGVDLAFQDVGALYMTANTVASAAPTPGGVGAVPAALIAALTAAGVDGSIAFSAVIVFRLITFWLPVPFAWVALQDLRRKDIL